ncbi:TonB-dependent receptor [Chlorobaculum sp. 24CR]|uniref:TonB-dependent receptor n=1 Tax=Chlorobaculum sp. 24CR TaxID=2508878 RepID=UPI00100B7003|nr:TonB-dependent receptor [Chlorobaculum sp. 24CR]RXK88239.1 TonB-dependent receptor [Chlorobaculum sp. 24CR]
MSVNNSPFLVKRHLKALAALMLLATPTARAESPNHHQSGEIVVTATRTPEDPWSLPENIETIPQETIREESVESIAGLLDNASGVTINGSGLWETIPTIRGFGSNRVLVLIDGDRESNLWAGRDPLTPFIDTGTIERIEILKGPASVLYGSDALGGVINIITRQPAFTESGAWQFKPSATVGYSSNDNGKYGNLVLDGANESVAIRLEASSRDHGSYKDGNGERVANSQFEGMNYGLSARWKIDERNELSASYRRSDIDDMGVPQKDGAAWSHFTTFETDTWKIGWHATDLGPVADLQLRGWIVDQKRVFDGNITSSDGTKYSLKGNTIGTGARGASLQLTFEPGEDNTLVGGIEYVREEAQSSETASTFKVSNDALVQVLTFPPVSPDAHRNHVGLFVQDSQRFNSGALLTGGVRYDYFAADAEDAVFTKTTSGGTTTATNVFSDKSDGAVTASLGYLHPLSSHLNANINLATGFRTPDLFERFSTRGSNPIILGNPDLEPEYSWNIDGGLKMKSETVSGVVSLFYSRVDNYIDLLAQTETFNGVPTEKYVNIPEAELYGFDASASWQVSDHLTLFGGISSVIGRNRDSDQRLSTIPPTNGKVGIRWDSSYASSGSWWFEINSELYADQNHPAEGEEATPGYSLVNLKTGIRFSQNVTLALAVNNLFDRTYRNHLNMADFLYEPGINVKTSLSVTL